MSGIRQDLIDLDEERPDVAAGWFALQRSGQMSAQDGADLTAWLDADPANLAAFEQVERTWAGVEGVRAYPDILALREQALRPTAPARLRPWRMRALAASLVVALLGGGTLLAIGRVHLPMTPIEQTFRTSVGQRTTLTLPDGSVLTLDTDTAVRTIESRKERRVELTRGQAFFKVTKDPTRPFVVVAGERTVTALGTAFGVRLEDGRFQLTMLEGKVEVRAPMAASAKAPRHVQTTQMTAGSQLVALEDRQWTIQPVNAERASSWTRGLLIYESTPLADVAEELNRYSAKKIVIKDPALAARRVNGTFRANDVEGAVQALEAYGLVRVSRQGEAAIELENTFGPAG